MPPPPIGLPGMDLPPGLTPQEQQAAEMRRREQLRAFKDAAPEVQGPPLPQAFRGPLAPASPGLPPAPAPAPGVPTRQGSDAFRGPPAPAGGGYAADDAQWSAPGTIRQGQPASPDPVADEAQWGGAGTQKQAGGDLPQPLANPKPAGISAEARQVLDAQDEKRQGALLGDIEKFQGYQKANLSAAEGQASGQGGPPLPMLPALDTIGSGDTGGNFPDVANQYRGLELLHSMGVPGTSQAASDAYAREKNADKQKGFQDRRSKLLEESTGTLSPLQQQDLRRRYNQVGLEESQAPDMPPALHINTQAGDQPGRYAMPSADRSRFVTPGTPEFEETQRAGTARSALAQALHDTPAWLQLEQARMHVQAQQQAQHSKLAGEIVAHNPNADADELIGGVNTATELDKLARLKNQMPGVPGGGGTQPGIKEQEQKVRDAKKTQNEATSKSPDTKEVDAWKVAVLPTLKTPEGLVDDLAGRGIMLKHGPTRRAIAKELENQGGSRMANIGRELERILTNQAERAGLLGHNSDTGQPEQTADNPLQLGNLTPGGVAVHREHKFPGVWRYTVQSPWRGLGFTAPANFRSNSAEDRAVATAKAHAAAETLKLLVEHGVLK